MARFLKDSDYSALIRTEIKALLTESTEYIEDEAKLLQAENMAVSQVKNYLFGRYDTAAIFGAVDDERDHFVVMLVMDCTIYHLYTAEAPERMPETRDKRYGDAIDALKKITTGDFSLDLPLKKDEAGNNKLPFRVTSDKENEDNRW